MGGGEERGGGGICDKNEMSLNGSPVGVVPGGIVRVTSSRTFLLSGLALLCVDILRRYGGDSTPSTPTGTSPTRKKKSIPFSVHKKIGSVRAKNLEFLRKFFYLFNLAMPSAKSPEWRTLLLLTMLLFLRTVISVSHVKLGAETATHFVSRRWAAVYRSIGVFALLSVPGSLVNAALSHFQMKLSEGISRVLTTQINNSYLDSKTFRQLAQRHHFLPRKKEVHKMEETLTQCVQTYSDTVGSVYCYLLKPIIDCVMYTISLGRVVGWQGPAFIWVFFLVRRQARNMLKVREGGHVNAIADLEESSKKVHRHIVKHSTELAINGCVERENQILSSLVTKRENVLANRRHFIPTLTNAFDTILLRYGASVAGYFVLLSPYLINLDRVRYKTSSIMTRDYIICLKSLTELNRAIFEIEESLSLLHGIERSTTRLADFLIHTKGIHFEEKRDTDRRTVRAPAQVRPTGAGRAPSPTVEDTVEEAIVRVAHPPPDQAETWVREWRLRGLPFQTTGVAGPLSIQGMDVVTPPMFNVELAVPSLCPIQAASGAPDAEEARGTLLVKDLNLTVTSGSNVLITGRKGSGKTSIFRVLGGIWCGEANGINSFFTNGTAETLHGRNVMYVAEEPHVMYNGTLREQIMYPLTHDEAKGMNVTDSDIAKLLCLVDHGQV